MLRCCIVLLGVLMQENPAAVQPRDYALTPVPFTAVSVEDAFWSKRLETNRTVTLPFAFRQCEATGRVDNFAIACKLKQGEQSGIYPFDDSDVYKIIEGASYSLAIHPDPGLERYLDSLIILIAGAQERDGYLYTARTNGAGKLARWAGPERWSHLSGSHELYNLGHLYEAAAAHYAATGKRSLLGVALKSADLVLTDFGPQGRHSPPGHQEIEIGLAKLFRVTGDRRYIDLARFFLDQRGRSVNGRMLWGSYSQDHKPVLEQAEAVGHSVRFMYMLAAMADVAALAGDTAYATAAVRLWRDVVTRKLYLTGGVGATGAIEGFGAEYDLPNISAYCETCASIAQAMANHRLFLLSGEACYLDILERVLYNGFLSGYGMTGDRFFYPNPLASIGHQRSLWFDCACCPSNITRFVPSIPGYIYAQRKNDVFVNLFVGSRVDLKVDGECVALRQNTDYPWSGRCEVVVETAGRRPFTLNLRIPGWVRNEPVPGDLYRNARPTSGKPVLMVNGFPVTIRSSRGFARVTRVWKKGDRVLLVLPMEIRRIMAHERVEADRGRVALERGPIVYCAEWPEFIDRPPAAIQDPARRDRLEAGSRSAGHVWNLVLPDSARLAPEFRPSLLGGVQVLVGEALAASVADGRLRGDTIGFTAIPYYAWAHRGPGEMSVWFPRTPDVAQPLGGPSISSLAVLSASPGNGAETVRDGAAPISSADSSHGYFRAPGDSVWVEYRFQRPLEISAADVYWFDNGDDVRIPKSWRMMLWQDGRWVPAYTSEKGWGVEAHCFNRVVLEASRTTAVRLEAAGEPGKCVGVLEWRVQ
jgi:hypothetical protein